MSEPNDVKGREKIIAALIADLDDPCPDGTNWLCIGPKTSAIIREAVTARRAPILSAEDVKELDRIIFGATGCGVTQLAQINDEFRKYLAEKDQR